MRKIGLTPRLLSLVLVVSMPVGCMDGLLDAVPPNEFSDETFWNTPEHAIMALNAAYDPLTSYNGLYGGVPWIEGFSPNAYNSWPYSGWQDIARGTLNAVTEAVAWRWTEAYRGIGRVNTLLARLDGIAMDGALKSHIRGEAHFLRALYYHNLVDFYGGVPLITDPPSLEQTKLSRASKQDVVELILSDLETAIASLPVVAPQIGRATKGAALALKARVLLYENRWAEATQAAKAVMDLGVYSLFPSYRGLFLPEKENNEEVIFDVQYRMPEQPHFWDVRLSPVTPTNEGWHEVTALPELVDDYYMTDGLPITTSPLYDPANPYANRDPRLRQTILYPGGRFRGMTSGVDFQTAFTGFYFRKYTAYTEEPSPGVVWAQSVTNIIVLRYADVLLMYAEAQNEAVGPDAAVYAAIDGVRTRAGMPNVPLGLGQAEMREVIRHERRIELAGEGLYYSDIRRWRIAERVIPAVRYETRVFDPGKHYLWPIPRWERDLMPNLAQNPGY
jgi:hypothetical protein